MITVLVKFKEYKESTHPMLDGCWGTRSKVVEVEEMTEINDLFKDNLIDIKILQP